MLGKTNVGGAKEIFAAIGAAYPVGSVCTCTNGEKTLTAKDTTGQFIFNIPEAGTWTVSCTDGEKTRSKSVAINAEGESANVALSYGLSIVLGGVHDTSVIGGWTATSKKFSSDATAKKPSLTSTASKLALQIDGTDYHNWRGGIITNNDIDFDAYDTITFKGEYSSGYSSRLVLSVLDRDNSYLMTNNVADVYAVNISSNTAHAKGNFAVTLDVSAIKGSYALAIGIGVQNINSFVDRKSVV